MKSNAKLIKTGDKIRMGLVDVSCDNRVKKFKHTKTLKRTVLIGYISGLELVDIER